MARVVIAVFRFVVDDDVTDAQVDDALTPAYASLDGEAAVDHDDSGNERTIPIYELTLNHVAGPPG